MPTPIAMNARRRTQDSPGRVRAALLLSVWLIAAVVSGCTQNPYLATPGGAAWQGQPVAVANNPTQAQIAELSRRVQLLDDNNRQLTTQLAQSEQQAQVYKDELRLVRTQLAEVTNQFESARMAANQAENQVRSFQASTQMRGGATIRPNTNLSAQASRLNLPNLAVQPDGDVVRIILPADQLFRAGTNQMIPQAAGILDPVAAQLRTVFPRQRIAVEGYTDNSPVYGGDVATSHQLSAAQSGAVLDFMVRRAGMPIHQLFTVAQGANNPRQSNDTPAGRAANRRIELVVYPETF
ncbi:Peptidoglycan-binding protein ArfA [Crateriforma conspicua]|uniref:Peptidoglycan-binding protein ArfA n=2 Tax=Crateriforma conspicua TaxID=2527996 RepID=A0A5C5Y9J1_9PLAN|nr:OmpA family protein [Crateriforma conspicua]QDV61906.1 Peptidoglycan-binding protein ArfA [Crateriforma conspicua]TWT71844.1 Peptidoglycan-binding protein ArfA [Crateriforma conspicua]